MFCLSSIRQVRLSGALVVFLRRYDFVLVSCAHTDVFVSFLLDSTFTYERFEFTTLLWRRFDSPDIKEPLGHRERAFSRGLDWNEDTAVWGPRENTLRIFERVGGRGIGKSPLPCIWDGVSCVVHCLLIFSSCKRRISSFLRCGQPLDDAPASVFFLGAPCIGFSERGSSSSTLMNTLGCRPSGRQHLTFSRVRPSGDSLDVA